MLVWRTIPNYVVTVRYRLLVEPPFHVFFPSCGFRVEWSHDYGGLHILQAARMDRTGYWRIHEFRSQLDFGTDPNARIPWTEGVACRHPSAMDTIFQRMIKDGRAQLVAGPHVEVSICALHRA